LLKLQKKELKFESYSEGEGDFIKGDSRRKIERKGIISRLFHRTGAKGGIGRGRPAGRDNGKNEDISTILNTPGIGKRKNRESGRRFIFLNHNQRNPYKEWKWGPFPDQARLEKEGENPTLKKSCKHRDLKHMRSISDLVQTENFDRIITKGVANLRTRHSKGGSTSS